MYASLKSFQRKPKTLQFGVSLNFIIKNQQCLSSIPPIVRKCADSLFIADVLATEGIFRRAGANSEIRALKKQINLGEEVNLVTTNVHVVAGLLKAFFRELKYPLLTYELYKDITSFLEWPPEDRLPRVTQIMREKLPTQNYEVMNYLIQFLARVAALAESNKMTSSNLAIVFGPNLLWSKKDGTLSETQSIIAFIDYLIENYEDVFR